MHIYIMPPHLCLKDLLLFRMDSCDCHTLQVHMQAMPKFEKDVVCHGRIQSVLARSLPTTHIVYFEHGLAKYLNTCLMRTDIT